MKYLLVTLVFSVLMYAQTMSTEEHFSLHTYNKRPVLKNTADKRAHRLHKVDEKEAGIIAEKNCKEANVKLKLTHYQRYLYYVATTPTCKVYINALDGSIIDPETIDKKTIDTRN